MKFNANNNEPQCFPDDDEPTFDDEIKEAEEFANWLVEQGFTDMPDASVIESFIEYGLLRNPKTNMVVFCRIGYETKTVTYDYTMVDVEELKTDLQEAGKGFYDCIDSTLEAELEKVEQDPEYLSSIVMSLDQWSGIYTQSCQWNFYVDRLKREVKERERQALS